MVSHRENEIPASQWRRQRNNIAVEWGEGGWSGCTDAGSSSKSASHASQSAPITGLIYTITGRGGGVFPLNSILEHH